MGDVRGPSAARCSPRSPRRRPPSSSEPAPSGRRERPRRLDRARGPAADRVGARGRGRGALRGAARRRASGCGTPARRRVAPLALGSLAERRRARLRCAGARAAARGSGIGRLVSAAVAATAEWTTRGGTIRVLAIALLGPPLAWIVGMPLVGVVGEVSWRLAWVVIPCVSALVALVVLAPAPVDAAGGSARRPARRAHPSGRGSLVDRRVARVLRLGGRARLHGRALRRVVRPVGRGDRARPRGSGAVVYVPGNLLFRRWVDDDDAAPARPARARRGRDRGGSRRVRPSAWFSLGAFALLSFLAGWPDARGQRARPRACPGAAAGRHGRAHGGSPIRVLRRRGRRRPRTCGGRLPGLGLAFAVLFVGRPCRTAPAAVGEPERLYPDAVGIADRRETTFEARIRALEESLSPFAVRSFETRGRPVPETGVGRPDAVPARSRPDRPLQAVPPAEGEDPGLHRSGGRPLPNANDTHARDDCDLAGCRTGAAAERGSDGGDRPRSRHRPHTVRARG